MELGVGQRVVIPEAMMLSAIVQAVDGIRKTKLPNTLRVKREYINLGFGTSSPDVKERLVE